MNISDIDPTALDWRISTRSSSGACVEVARAEGAILFRHSHRPEAEVIVYSPKEIAAFFAGVKAGEFDYLLAGHGG